MTVISRDPVKSGGKYTVNLNVTHTVIPRLTSDPTNEFFG